MDKMDFAYELKSAINHRGFTYKDLAPKVGITSNYLRLLTQGKYVPSENVIKKLASVLDWPELKAIWNGQRVIYCASPLCPNTFIPTGLNGGGTSFCSAQCHSDHLSVKREIGRVGTSPEAKSIASFCFSCEPEGVCRVEDCPLRPFSPLPYAKMID